MEMTGWAMPAGCTRFHLFTAGEAWCRLLRYDGPVRPADGIDPDDVCYWCRKHDGRRRRMQACGWPMTEWPVLPPPGES